MSRTFLLKHLACFVPGPKATTGPGSDVGAAATRVAWPLSRGGCEGVLDKGECEPPSGSAGLGAADGGGDRGAR